MRREQPVADSLAPFLGTRTGLVSGVAATFPSRSTPQFVQTTPSLADLDTLVGEATDTQLGVSGKGSTLADSVTTCVGEAVERYCLLFDHEDLLEVGSHTEMDAAFDHLVDFDLIDRYTAEQLECHDRIGPISRNAEMTWCPATDLTAGHETFVPAELLLYDIPDSYPSTYIGTTNGAAAGPSLPSAIRSGLYEYIERDAIMRLWYTQTTPPRLSVDQFDAIPQSFAPDSTDNHLSVFLFSADSPLSVPVVGCVIVDDRDQTPKVVVGGGAGPTYEEAVRDALAEAAQVRPYVFNMLREHESVDQIDQRAIHNFDENVLYYADPDQFDDVSFLLDGETVSPPASPVPREGDRSQLQWLLEEFQRHDLAPLALDVTAPDVQTTGVVVVKTFVPGLLPLSLPSLPHANHPRVRTETVTEIAHPYP